MKYIYIIIGFLLNSYAANGELLNKSEVIDELDTVYLNFDNAVISGNLVDIPLYINSDDNIYTLDFSFWIDTFKVKYVSIIDHTGHIQFAEYFNPSDSKLRFTSNSFQKYPTGSTKVISIRFKIQESSFMVDDLRDFMSYLNGDACSSDIKGKDIVLSSSQDLGYSNVLQITMFPSLNEIQIKSSESGYLQIFTMEGFLVQSNFTLQKDGTVNLSLNRYPKGVLVLKFNVKNKLPSSYKILNI